MRFVVIGLGGIGGTLATRLYEAGYGVLGVARGPHLAAVAEHGLQLEVPEGHFIADIEVVDHPCRVGFTERDVVVLAVKSQDTSAVVAALAHAAPTSVPVLCAQTEWPTNPTRCGFSPTCTAWS